MTRMSALLARVTATDSATMEDLFTEDEWAAIGAAARSGDRWGVRPRGRPGS